MAMGPIHRLHRCRCPSAKPCKQWFRPTPKVRADGNLRLLLRIFFFFSPACYLRVSLLSHKTRSLARSSSPLSLYFFLSLSHSPFLTPLLHSLTFSSLSLSLSLSLFLSLSLSLFLSCTRYFVGTVKLLSTEHCQITIGSLRNLRSSQRSIAKSRTGTSTILLTTGRRTMGGNVRGTRAVGPT